MTSSKTSEHLRCGKQLKTKRCAREAWWPGGRCSHHGYGATTFEGWARGLAKREGPLHWYAPRLKVHYWRSKLTWMVQASTGRSWRYYAEGDISPDELAVVADRLASEGVIDDRLMVEIGEAVADALREQLRLRGDSARAEALAGRLRRLLGCGAMAVDNYVVLPLADVEPLLDELERGLGRCSGAD